MLLAWQDSSELRQLLSQLSCAGERSGRGGTLPAGAEEGSRCVIPFCSLDGRDHRANTGHEGSSAPLKSHMPPRTIDPRTRVWQSTLSWQPAPGLHGGQRHTGVPNPPQRQRCQGCRGDTANPALESLHECEKRLENCTKH